VSRPARHAGAGDPLRLAAPTVATDDPDPKALACSGLLVRPDADAAAAVWRRFVDERPVSAGTSALLDWGGAAGGTGRDDVGAGPGQRRLARPPSGTSVAAGPRPTRPSGERPHRALLPSDQAPVAQSDRAQMGPRQAPRRRADSSRGGEGDRAPAREARLPARQVIEPSIVNHALSCRDRAARNGAATSAAGATSAGATHRRCMRKATANRRRNVATVARQRRRPEGTAHGGRSNCRISHDQQCSGDSLAACDGPDPRMTDAEPAGQRTLGAARRCGVHRRRIVCAQHARAWRLTNVTLRTSDRPPFGEFGERESAIRYSATARAKPATSIGLLSGLQPGARLGIPSLVAACDALAWLPCLSRA
jgi:hypothetical protein